MQKQENKKLSKKKLNKSILWLLEPQNRTEEKPWADNDEKEPPLKRQRTK